MEGKRVLTSRLFLAVLAGLVVLNCFLFLCQRPDSQIGHRAYGEEYHQRVESLSAKSWEDALHWCVDYQQAQMEAIASGEWAFDEDRDREEKIVEELKAQYEYLLGYDEYLTGIQKQAKLLQSVSLFAEPDSFGYQNTVKTAEDFGVLEDVQVTAGHDRAVTVFFEDKWTDYSILIVIFLVCSLFVAERREGLWPQIHAASGGRSVLVLRRIGILLAASTVATLLLVGVKILLCGWAYHGLGEWDRALQSIPMFQNVPLKLTVGQFWCLYLGVKILGMFWVGLVLWLVLALISNLGLAIGAVGLVLAVEFACTAIPSGSMFAAARYINVFSFIDLGLVFTRYLNLSLFGWLVSGLDLVLMLLPVLCGVTMLLIVWIGERKYPVSVQNRLLRWLDRAAAWLDPKVCGGGEARKLLIRRRGLWMLLLLVPVVSRMDTAPRAYVAWDPFIQHYQQYYEGPIDQQKLDTIQEKLDGGMDSYNKEGLTIVFQDAQKAPEGSWIVHSAPYEAIWSNNAGNYQRTASLIALLFLTMILAQINSQERQDQMTVLLRSTSGGRGRLFLKKQGLLLLLTVLVWGLIYGTELYRIIGEYGMLTGLDAPAYSLKMFRSVGLGLSIRWTLVLYYLLKLVVLTVVAELCCFLSGRCARNRDAMLLCCGVILLPAALAAIGSKIGTYLSFLLPLSLSELLYGI